MKVVDIHSHFFSRPFFETLAALAPDADLNAVAGSAGFELPDADTGRHLARWLAELDRHDVEHMVTFASLLEEAPAVVEAVRLSKGRLSGCALVNPRAPEADRKLAGLLDEGGLAGALFFPAMHHFRIDGEEVRALFRQLSERRALVFVHCGLLVVNIRDRLGLPRPYDLSYANPLDLVPAANAARGANFIIPHFGAGFFREALMAGSQCENIHLDTSSSNSWIRTQPSAPTLREVFARALDVFGADRILFGTDSNVFPAGWRSDRLDEQRRCLDDLGVGAAEQEKIFRGNAARLLSGIGTGA